MGVPLRLLHIEDSEDDTLIALRELRRGGYDVTVERVETREAMHAALARGPSTGNRGEPAEPAGWDLILSDHQMPQFSSTEALAIYKASGLDIPFIILSGTMPDNLAMEAMRNGAHDYILKSNLTRLVPAIARELRDAQVRREKRRAEVSLRASQQLLEKTFASLRDAVFILNADTAEIVDCNPAAAEIFGYSRAEMQGQTTEFLHVDPAALAEFRQHLVAAVEAKGYMFLPEFRMKRKNGQIFPTEHNVVPLTDEKGKRISWVSVVRDITVRKQAQAQIQEQLATLAALYDLSRALANADDFDAVLDLITRGAVNTVRSTFSRLVLLEEDELIVRAAYPLRVLDRDLQVGHREPITTLPSCQLALAQNKPIVLRASQPELDDAERAALFLDIAKAVCLVPLHAKERALGLLMLGEARTEEREPFTPEKVRLARSLGDQAEGALHRALLRLQTEQRLKHITALRNIDAAITGSTDLGLVLKVVLQETLDQLHVDAAAVLLLNPHTHTLAYTAGRGFRTRGIERSRLQVGEEHAGRAVLERAIVHVPNLSAPGAAFKRLPLVQDEGFITYLGVPLVAKGQVKGVLEVYHRTPLAPDQEWLNFLKALAGQSAIAIDNAGLFTDLQRSNSELILSYDSTIEGWSRALDLRDKETEGHTQRVTEMTERLARAMGTGEAELVQVRRGALLHDIGKMGIPDSILLKPGSLTEEEWVTMRKHPVYAYELLSPIPYLRPALDIPYCHHEKWDGTGYPRGLKGEQIPLSARIFAVVDVWDALRSDRPYRNAWTEEQVSEHIRAGSGKHFDPKVVEAFLIMEK